MRFPPPIIIQGLRDIFPRGTRIELLQMDDPFTNLCPGDQGTVEYVDDAGSIHIQWDSGSTLAAIYGVDRICKL